MFQIQKILGTITDRIGNLQPVAGERLQGEVVKHGPCFTGEYLNGQAPKTTIQLSPSFGICWAILLVQQMTAHPGRVQGSSFVATC